MRRPHGYPLSRLATISTGANFIGPTSAQLLRAIAIAIRGTGCAWASVPVLCEVLNVPKSTLMSAINGNSWWCTHINGYVIAKCKQAIFAETPERITDAPHDMFALALGMTFGLQPWVPKQALVR